MRGFSAFFGAAVVAISCATFPDVQFASDDADSDSPGGAGGVDDVGGTGGTDRGGAAGATVGGAAGTSAQGGRAGNGSGGGSGDAGGRADGCDNETLDGTETDVDCGGDECPRCGPGRRCVVAGDCIDRVCTTAGICDSPGCQDGITNNSETDRDCGGPDCEVRCVAGRMCRIDDDCETRLCLNNTCVPAACEPGSICGTSECRCPNGEVCVAHDECASGNCGGGACAVGPRSFSRNEAPDATNPTSAAIQQTFLIRNTAPTPVPAGELTLRYYFFRQDLVGMRGFCDASRAVASTDCDGVTVTVFAEDSAFADTYVEVRVSDAASLDPGSQTRELPITVEGQGSGFQQQGDYSFSESSVFGENTTMTMYRRGVLIWGAEPP